MMGSSFLRMLLAGAAKEKLRAEARRAVQANVQRAVQPAGNASASPPGRCLVGAVFALSAESGGLEDLLEEHITTRAAGLLVHEGRLHEQPVVLIISGPGGQCAARAAAALIAGHRPQWIVAAGFAGGLSAEVRRYDIVLASEVLEPGGSVLTLDLPPGGKVGSGATSATGEGAINVDVPIDLAGLVPSQSVHQGRVLSVDRLVRMPEQKRALAEQYRAAAVDMESYAVVKLCRAEGIPAMVVRIVTDPASERLPAEIETLLRQPSAAGRFGAAVGAVWRRPGSFKELMRLKETALVASDRLAAFLAQLVAALPRLSLPGAPAD